MAIPLEQKITQLQNKYSNNPEIKDVLRVCELLLDLVEQNRGDLTESYEEHVRINQRLKALEKTQTVYKGAR